MLLGMCAVAGVNMRIPFKRPASLHCVECKYACPRFQPLPQPPSSLSPPRLPPSCSPVHCAHPVDTFLACDLPSAPESLTPIIQTVFLFTLLVLAAGSSQVASCCTDKAEVFRPTMVHSRRRERNLGKKGASRAAGGTSRGHVVPKGVARQFVCSAGSGSSLVASHWVGNMEPQEISAVPSCPSNFKSTTVRETGTPCGLERGPRRAVGLCDRCYNHGITTQIMGQEHNCHFQACQCHNCVIISEPCKVLPTMTTRKREQGTQIKKHQALGLMKNTAIAPRAPLYVKNMATGAGVNTGKVNIMPQPQAYPCYIPNLGTPPSVFLFSQTPEPTFLPCTPVITEPQLVFAISGQPQGAPMLPATCSRLILQPCATLDPRLLQPQVQKGSEQDVVAASECQRKLEAAEALLALKYSRPVPTDSTTLAQPCGPPAPAGERTLQSPIPAECPRPATSNSLPGGHLGCI
uniref:DM domain-containing protein n=1 Tax=Oryctolagus cuniculus TaxID=9986 RepID=G1T2X9_RABIT